MSAGPWVIYVIVALVVAAIAIEAYLKRNRRRVLSRSQPDPKLKFRKNGELGQEATNLEMIERANLNNQRMEKANQRQIRRDMK